MLDVERLRAAHELGRDDALRAGLGGDSARAHKQRRHVCQFLRRKIVNVLIERIARIEAEADPINPYAGKETLLDKWLGRDKTVEEPVADVPEPDASDRVAAESVAQPRPAPHVPEAPLPSQNNEDFRPAAPDSYNTISRGDNANAAF